jgi:hypothetical protein
MSLIFGTGTLAGIRVVRWSFTVRRVAGRHVSSLAWSSRRRDGFRTRSLFTGSSVSHPRAALSSKSSEQLPHSSPSSSRDGVSGSPMWVYKLHFCMKNGNYSTYFVFKNILNTGKLYNRIQATLIMTGTDGPIFWLWLRKPIYTRRNTFPFPGPMPCVPIYSENSHLDSNTNSWPIE